MSRSIAGGGTVGVAVAPPPGRGVGGGVGSFELTPHKIAVCHLVHFFVPPSMLLVPSPFTSVSQHNRLGLLLFSLARSCDDFVEPPLEELINQLETVGDLVCGWLSERLANSLAALSSPDDLFNFFENLRGTLGPSEGMNLEDNQLVLDPNSQLGVFLRCCILAFNLLSFEGVCHLLTNIGIYCHLSNTGYELPEEEDEFSNESEFNELLEDADLDLESAAFHRYNHKFVHERHPGESSSYLQTASSPYDLIEAADRLSHLWFFSLGIILISHVKDGVKVVAAMESFMLEHQCPYFHSSADSKFMPSNVDAEMNEFVGLQNDVFRSEDRQGFLRSKWQIEGYLNMQADCLEKDAGPFPLNSFSAILNQLKNLAPELHRVQYLQYLNGLHHDDYLPALDSLHCYFDYSAGMEGVFNRSSNIPSDIDVGRYETALLCLGTMHSRFGHPKKALEALTEAVRIAQQNNDDSCLAYTLAALGNLLYEIGTSSATGVIGSPYSFGTSTGSGIPLSTQQQLLVLLKRSLKRAEDMKMTCLLAFNRLELAKFDLKHVKRPFRSFGPKSSTKLRTCPISVCKELRLSSQVLSEFGSDGVSLPFDDVAFSTSWLKNLAADSSPCPNNSQKVRSISVNDYDIFQFDALPNPIPGSVLQLAGASYLLRATSWELYGSAPLVRINSLIYATCFPDAASSTDLLVAYTKLIQHLAVYKGYKEAFVALKLAEEEFSSISNSHIQLLKLQLLHERALHIGHLKVAQQICDEFGVLASSVSGVDMELKSEASLRHARTLLAAKQFSQAAAVAHSLFCTCYKFNMQVENATVLLLLAEIHKKAGNAVLGLPYALASLSFCQSFNLDLLGACATLTLAELWLSLGSSYVKSASSLAYRTLPMILGHGGLELRARANVVVAKCHLSDPTFSISEDPDVVLDPLSQAAEELQILEYHELAAEAFYLVAIVHDRLGQLEEREAAAASFREHVIALENPKYDEDPLAV